MGFMNFLFISAKFNWDDAFNKRAEAMTLQLNFYCHEFPAIISVCKLGCESFGPISKNVTVGSSAWFPESFELSVFDEINRHEDKDGVWGEVKTWNILSQSQQKSSINPNGPWFMIMVLQCNDNTLGVGFSSKYFEQQKLELWMLNFSQLHGFHQSESKVVLLRPLARSITLVGTWTFTAIRLNDFASIIQIILGQHSPLPATATITRMELTLPLLLSQLKTPTRAFITSRNITDELSTLFLTALIVSHFC